MKKLPTIILLSLAACALCACGKNPENPFHAYEKYYTQPYDNDHDIGSIIVKNLSGDIIYENSTVRGYSVKHMMDGVLKIITSAGSDIFTVDYVSIPYGKVGNFYNPVLDGHGIVCEVEHVATHGKMSDYELIVYKMFSDSGEKEVIHIEPFQAPTTQVPEWLIRNASFLGENILKITHATDVEWTEQTKLIAIGEWWNEGA